MARVACIFSIFSVTGVHWVVTEERLTLFVGGGTRFQPAIRQEHLLGETHAAARFVAHAWRVYDSRVELALLAVRVEPPTGIPFRDQAMCVRRAWTAIISSPS